MGNEIPEIGTDHGAKICHEICGKIRSLDSTRYTLASINGVFAAAKESGSCMIIGCDVDQYDDGAKGDSNIMLTSTLKVMDVNVQRQLEAIYDGTFTGQDAYLDTKTDSVGYVSEEGRQQLSEDTLAALAEVYELVKDGTIVPAADSTVNDYTPDNFPGL